MKVAGPVLTVPDGVNTDLIYPGQYLQIIDEAEIGQHALEGLGEPLTTQIRPGQVLVAGEGLGAGSSRFQAVLTLKQRGFVAIVAKSVARSFFRLAINQGLPVVVSQELAEAAQTGEPIALDLEQGRAWLGQQVFTIPALPPYLLTLLAHGGILNMVRAELASRNAGATSPGDPT